MGKNTAGRSISQPAISNNLFLVMCRVRYLQIPLVIRTCVCIAMYSKQLYPHVTVYHPIARLLSRSWMRAKILGRDGRPAFLLDTCRCRRNCTFGILFRARHTLQFSRCFAFLGDGVGGWIRMFDENKLLMGEGGG